ncbi:MAG: M48 family metalloprotease [Acidobacteriia bacterium]|nr:M48 family metalloprotease [Terriglobia bacterium]
MRLRCFAGLLPLLALAPAQSVLAQSILPQNAQTDLYFPHLADGGPASGQWQTRFTFINPNGYPATVKLSLYSNTGGPLNLDLGGGSTNQVTTTIPPNGTVVLRSQIGATATEGWAYGAASLPVEANVAFRLLQNGVAKLEITAEPTLPSMAYRSVAGPLVGIAVANVYSVPIEATVTVYNSSGQTLGQALLNVPAHGHSSFNLRDGIANLPASFSGNVLIAPQTPGQVLLAWAVYADSSGVVSSLPDGRAGFPLAQPDQINTAFVRLVSAYQTYLAPQTSIPGFGAAPQLVMSSDTSTNAINARAASGTTVQINLALAELIGDSPSELAFVVGHELGHIYQQRTGEFVWYPAGSVPDYIEWDADVWGLLSSLIAGYDPYAGAGALGKLGMATGTANLGTQLWEDLQTATDAHGSFSTRIDNLTRFLELACGSSQAWQSYCSQYKAGVHPHFPALPSVPLMAPRPLKPRSGAATASSN